MQSDVSPFVRRYARWIERRRVAIIVTSIAIAVVAGAVASRLALLADFSYLLPQHARSVQDLRAIEQRTRAIGSSLVAIESSSPVHRAAAAHAMRDAITALDPALVSSVTFDHRDERGYAWRHRWLFADLADLEAARDALADEIARAKLAGNPLYVGLDDAPARRSDAADTLRGKLRDAERDASSPAELVSADGRLQLLIVRLAYSPGDIDRDAELVAAIDRIAAGVRARFPDVTIGQAGDAKLSLAEHDAILDGMLRATAVTVLLVLAALAWYFRSSLAIGALSWSLVVATLVTFAFTKLAIGYLNAASAFLSSIVIGNGINVAILVTARFLDELRAGRPRDEALAITLQRTVAATFAAAATASVAYASLVITVFRGFRHFGIIGGVGILLCWISAYVVLPAALSLGHALGMRPRRAAPIGGWLARLAPKRPAARVACVLAIVAIAGVAAARFLLGSPFESNFRNLRSHNADIDEVEHWREKIDAGFGQGVEGGFVVAVARAVDAAPLQRQLRALDADRPSSVRLFDRITSIDDLLPADQQKKLVVLAQIRALLGSNDLDALDAAERAEALRLRPPDDLRALGPGDVPAALARPFVEADGTRGRILLAAASKRFDQWNADATLEFASGVRAIELPPDTHLGGAWFVFADVLDAVLSDGPRATLAAALGAALVVLLVLGRTRHALVTLACGASGTVLMLGAAALLGFKVNFLDFVALPITIGIGIEYSVNVAARMRELDARDALASTGGAVFLCSYTTIVGYGSLVLSQNLGIRSFGLAAMLGEITCLAVAIVLAPALLQLATPRAPGADAPTR